MNVDDEITFDNLNNHVTSISDFPLGYRFTDKRYDRLPESDLKRLKPLNAATSAFLCKYLESIDSHKNDVPFKDGFSNRFRVK